jgi:hypothetical protein
MNVSVLLRLIPAERTGGRLAGQAELVESGETTVFADHDEMLAFLRRATTGTNDAAESEEIGPSDATQPL